MACEDASAYAIDICERHHLDTSPAYGPRVTNELIDELAGEGIAYVPAAEDLVEPDKIGR